LARNNASALPPFTSQSLMKTHSTSLPSAVFDLRVFLGLILALAGVLPAVLGLGTFSAQAQQNYSNTSSIHPLVPAFFDCSKIREMGIGKQQNLRAGAIMIFCGEAKGGEPGESSLSSAFSKLVQRTMAPMTYGTTDVDLITGIETFPHITQSETFTTAILMIPLRLWSPTTTHADSMPIR